MKLVGLMPVRNEAWCLGLSARVALTWCDELLVGLHECTDASADIVKDIYREVPGRITVATREVGKWDEMAHRQKLLTIARDRGATCVAVTDADEIPTGNLLAGFPSGRCCMQGMAEIIDQEHILQLPLYNLRGGIDRYHANGLWGKRIVSVSFADNSALHWSGDRHHSREPQGKKLVGFEPIAQGDGGIMHLWGASERRLLAKHALYKVTERLRWPDKRVREIDWMYSQCVKGSIGEDASKWTYDAVPEAWWAPYAAWMKYLDVDAEPWQEAEVRRLVAEHGRERFAGLDLFGVT